MLSTDEIILVGVVVGAFVLIIFSRLTPDLVALLVLLILGFSRVVEPEDAITGFGSPVVLTIAGLFIITHALETTGVIHWIAGRIYTLGKGSEARLVLVFMGMGALLSLVMNNIAAGAVLLPAAVRVGRLANVRLSKLLIPISFGTLLGGMATYLTTANIIMSDLLEKQGRHGLNMMSFMPTGSLIVLGGLAYMLLVGRRLLPEQDVFSQRITSTDLYETYQLAERLWEVRVLPKSTLVGKELSQSGIGEKLGLTVLVIWRGRRAIISPGPGESIAAGDSLLVLGRQERVEQMQVWEVELRALNTIPDEEHQVVFDVTEVIIPPRSGMVGRTLKEVRFRTKFGLTAIALWRGGRSYRTDVGEFTLQVGDALLMLGPFEKLEQLATDRDYLVLNSHDSLLPKYPHKVPWALLITGMVLTIAILDLLPLPEVMLAGAVALVLVGCLNMEEAYRAIEWRVIFLIAGMLPVSLGMVETGLATRLGQLLVDSLAHFGAFALLTGLFTATMLLTQIIGGQVAALVIGPVAINAALQMGINPQATAVVVAIGCSTAFLTPIAHPVNILMMGPAGYSFKDFFRVGMGITLVTFMMLMLGLLVFWDVH